MNVPWERYSSAMDLLFQTESSVDAIVELKQKCVEAAEENPLIPILYGLLAQSRQGVSDCKRPKEGVEGVTEEWLKEFMARSNAYSHTVGALAMALSACEKLEFEPSSIPTSIAQPKKRRFKVKRR